MKFETKMTNKKYPPSWRSNLRGIQKPRGMKAPLLPMTQTAPKEKTRKAAASLKRPKLKNKPTWKFSRSRKRRKCPKFLKKRP